MFGTFSIFIVFSWKKKDVRIVGNKMRLLKNTWHLYLVA